MKKIEILVYAEDGTLEKRYEGKEVEIKEPDIYIRTKQLNFKVGDILRPKKKPESSPIGYFYFWNKNTLTIKSGQQEVRNVEVFVPDKSKLVIPVIRPGETHKYEFDPKKGWIKDSIKHPYTHDLLMKRFKRLDNEKIKLS